MRASGLIVGVIVLLLGILLFGTSFSYPALPGQAYGAGTLPRLLGVSGAILGLVLISKEWPTRGHSPLGSLDAWVRDRRIYGVAGVLASILFFIFAAPLLGFIFTAFAILVALMIFGGVRLPVAIGTSLAATLIIYFAFSHLLLVPLSRGLVESML